MERNGAPAALVVIDFQAAIDHPKWLAHGGRNNPEAEGDIARLLAAWRRSGAPIYHVRHDSRFADSPYRPGQPGHEFKAEAKPRGVLNRFGECTGSLTLAARSPS